MEQINKTQKNDDRPTMINKDGNVTSLFSNIVNISINNREMFIDFGIVAPKDSNNPKSEGVILQSRIVMTLEHAKELSAVLSDVLAKNSVNE